MHSCGCELISIGAGSSPISTLMPDEHKQLPSSCSLLTPPPTPLLRLLKISVLCGRNAFIRCLSGLRSPEFTLDSVILGNAGSTLTHNLGAQQQWGSKVRTTASTGTGTRKMIKGGRNKTKFAQGGANRWEGETAESNGAERSSSSTRREL